MCTATWWRGEAGNFAVFFNRDESRRRARSIPVQAVTTPEGVRFLAPRDPEAGGTWLMANHHGLVAGVLNHYEAAGVLPPGKRSRGTLPTAVASCPSTTSAIDRVRTLPLADFAPFIFVAWDRAGEAAWVWDGNTFGERTPLEPPLATSSYRTAEVLAWRQARFCELVGPDPAAASRDRFEAFHNDTTHADGAFNVRMRRPDARTESICLVSVNGGEVRFEHRRELDDSIGTLDVTTCRLPRV